MADNQVPQRDQDVVVYGSFNGLRSDVTPERFGPGDLTTALNVDLDKSGRLSRRAGYTQQIAGACHSLWADPQQEWCLFVQGGVLKRLNANYTTTTVLKTLADPFAQTDFERVNDRIYYSNGTDAGLIECQSGQVRGWGLPVPPLPVPIQTVGQIPAGRYQFMITWMRSDGQESGAPLAGLIALPAGAGLNFQLPTAPAEASATILYLSTPNSEVLYMAAVVPAAQTSVLYTNDTLELSTPLQTQFLKPAPAGQLVAFYRGRLFVAQGDTLFASSPFGYELFDLREYIQLDGKITLLAPMTDREMYDTGKSSGFFIGTDRSCGVLVGSAPSEFQYVPKTPYGAIPYALDYVDGALFADDSLGARPLPMWLTTQGLCIGQPNMEIRNLTRTKYTFTAAGQGAAIFQPGPNRFIATANL